jgi:hypothetical protein
MKTSIVKGICMRGVRPSKKPIPALTLCLTCFALPGQCSPASPPPPQENEHRTTLSSCCITVHHSDRQRTLNEVPGKGVSQVYHPIPLQVPGFSNGSPAFARHNPWQLVAPAIVDPKPAISLNIMRRAVHRSNSPSSAAEMPFPYRTPGPPVARGS